MPDETKTEKIEQVEPNPTAQAPAPAEAKKDAAQVAAPGSAEAKTQDAHPQEAKPSESTLSNLAYIKMRQEKKALKAELEALRAAKQATPQAQQPPATSVIAGQQEVDGPKVASVDPAALKAEILRELRDTQKQAEAEQQKKANEEAALKQLAGDKDLSSIPDGIAEVLDLIDNDSRLSRLNDIDPAIALREAKNAVLAKKGISASTPKPVTHPGGGGSMSVQMTDFDTLADKLKTLDPSSKEFREVFKRFNEAARNLK